MTTIFHRSLKSIGSLTTDFLLMWIVFTVCVFLLSAADMLYNQYRDNYTEATWELILIIAPVVSLMLTINFVIFYRLLHWSIKSLLVQKKGLMGMGVLMLIIVFLFAVEFPLRLPGIIGKFQQESGEIADVMAYHILLILLYTGFEHLKRRREQRTYR